MHRGLAALSLVLVIRIFGVSSAYAQEPIPYGSPISLEVALKVVAAAEAENILD